jgi:hypothetical protein
VRPISAANSEQAKALLRILIAELRFNRVDPSASSVEPR